MDSVTIPVSSLKSDHQMIQLRRNENYLSFFPRQGRRQKLLVYFLFLYTFYFTELVAGQELAQPYQISDYSKAYVGRIYSLTTTSPVFNALKNNETAVEALDEAFELIEQLDKVVQERRETNHTEACNIVYTSRWTGNFRRLTPIFQVGSVEETCNARLDAGVAVKSGSLGGSVTSGARQKILNVRQVLFEASKKGLTEDNDLLPTDGNWTRGVFELRPSERANDGQRCLMDSASAYFTNNRWYLRAGVTNHNVNDYIEDWRRQFIIEFVPHPSSNSSSSEDMESLRLIHPRPSDGRNERSSSIVLMWGGRAYMGTTPNDDDFSDPISPVSQAFRENLVHIDQASDSITISNIAILALPMAMNLIPVAFIADITTLGSILYIVLTDVLSTVPFLIKGVELIVWAAPSKELVISFHGGDETLRLVEVMAVRCRGETLFQTTGIIFIIVGFVVMVLGIFLEVWANRYMKRLKKRRAMYSELQKADLKQAEKRESLQSSPTSEVEGPFGRVVSEFTTTGLFGSQTQSARRLYKSQKENLKKLENV